MVFDTHVARQRLQPRPFVHLDGHEIGLGPALLDADSVRESRGGNDPFGDLQIDRATPSPADGEAADRKLKGGVELHALDL